MLSEKMLQFANFGAEWVLWLLFGLSAISIAMLADRAILFIRTREKIAKLSESLGVGDLEAARREVKGDSLIRNVIRAGLDKLASGVRESEQVEQAMLGAMARERARYESRLAPLGTIGNNAPFIGLFGTVLGIIQAFGELAAVDASQAASNKVVIGAIGEALVATAIGILVAIPAVAAYNWAKSHIATRLKHAEALMRTVLQGLG